MNSIASVPNAYLSCSMQGSQVAGLAVRVLAIRILAVGVAHQLLGVAVAQAVRAHVHRGEWMAAADKARELRLRDRNQGVR